MDSLPPNPIYDFKPNTLEDVRKQYNLDAPGRMDESIDLLENWIKKENHFLKKDFPRSYLERCIINCKGSVEKAKKNMESICTWRNLKPQLYGDYDFKNDFQKMFDVINLVGLPNYADDHHRVILIKCSIQKADKDLVRDFFRYSLSFCDYWKAHDYFNGCLVVLDYRDMSISEYMASIDLMEVNYVTSMYVDVYKVRIKGIHILTTSKIIDLVVKFLKQVMSPKVKDRFYVHNNLEELYKFVPKEILPLEYGGKERSLKKLQDDWADVLTSQEHRNFMKEMNQSVLGTRVKEIHKDNNDLSGISGTFRSLNLD